MSADNYHHGNLKKSLLQAALNILEDEGEDTLSLRKLGSAVGVSQTAIYSHFKNKNALFQEIAKHGYLLLSKQMRDASARSNTPEQNIYALAKSYLVFAQKHPNLFNLIFSSGFSKLHQGHADLFEISQDSFSQMLEVIDAYAEENGLAYPKQAIALATWSMIHGLCHIVNGDRLGEDSQTMLNEGQLLNLLVEILLTGIRPR